MVRTLPNMPIGIDPNGRDQSRMNRDLTEAVRQLWLRNNELDRLIDSIGSSISSMQKQLTVLMSVSNNVRRITAADSPYVVSVFDLAIYCDTDTGAITVLLPPGVNQTRYTIKNCGSSGNDVTVTPNGTELLFGFAASETLIDSEVIDIQYETTEGWR